MEEFDANAVFNGQKEACGNFFHNNLPVDESEPVSKEKKPKNMRQLKGHVYDITGFDAEKVVALLSRIVNDRQEFKPDKTFYLLLNSHEPGQDDNREKFFKFAPNPSRDQPGNAMVSRGLEKGLTYNELNADLKSKYNGNTKSFAQHIKKLFQNNSKVPENFPQATFEVYILLLFEIARRLVREDAPTRKKEELDDLPIGSAIARSVKLLELGKEETCSFDDVFCSSSDKFYCYTGEPEERETAIRRINKTAHSQIERMNHGEELEKMFRSSTDADELADRFENMVVQEESGSDTESD